MQQAGEASGGTRTPLRVSLLLPSLDGGGAERSLMTVAAQLDARGFDLELVVGQTRGALASILPHDLRVVELGCRHMRTALPPLVSYLRRRRPACLLSTLEHAAVLSYVARTVARTETKLVFRLANTLSSSGPRRLWDMETLTRMLVRPLYRRGGHLIAGSQGVADDLICFLGVDPSRVRVIPNPVVGPELFRLGREPVAHPWFAAGEPPVVVGMGRLTRQKNFPLLMDAFHQVRRHREARLLILGEGEQRNELLRLANAYGIARDFSLPGFDPNPFKYLTRAAVYVLSSDYEGLPGGLIQALAWGARVVATDCPSGPREVLRGGRYGRLVPVGDASALAAAIEEALTGEEVAPPPPVAWRPYTFEHAIDGYAAAIKALVSA